MCLFNSRFILNRFYVLSRYKDESRFEQNEYRADEKRYDDAVGRKTVSRFRI